MHRWELSRFVKTLIQEVEAAPVPWLQRIRSAEGPLSFERSCGAAMVQVEMQLLETNKDFIQIGVGASSGGLSDYFPVSMTIVIPAEDAASD